MDATGAHDDYVRLPCSFDPETAAALVDRLAAAWTALPRSIGPHRAPTCRQER
ncbi:hypothetical protein ACH4A8_15495 [Streptomyces vietnamensis]|uniref:hypothetical protein n=1 Tax=Streptomyces vietnamensis TaxID=362257 RepID=UPI0037A7E4A9